MNIVDLYSGIGGGSLGLRQAGLTPAFACDADADARLIYATNFLASIRDDIRTLNAQEVVHPEIVFAAPDNKEALGMIKWVLDFLKPRAFLLQFPVRKIDMSKLASKRSFNFGEYHCWHDTLRASNFGLAHKRKNLFIVGFRKDVKLAFKDFPFPEPVMQGTLRPLLEADVPSNLYKKKFEGKVLTPDDTAPALPLSYYKDYRSITVDAGKGPRRLSVLECKRLIGFPDDFRMPVSDTTAYRLLAQAACPAMIQSLALEIQTWINY